ncbi:MAG: PepSY domain-containing protein, partial [Clostridiales bacterium]|nr:PepSY domain-containing protein [Clostridiales bacterium]
MKNKNIENKIKIAVQHSVPDVLDSILSDCEEQKGEVLYMNTQNKKKRNWVRPFATIAAVFALFIVGIAGYNVYGNRAVDSIISFDINPSLEMKVNRNEKVLEVNPLNEEGEKVIGNMSFKNTDLEITVNALIGSMLTKGYIDDIQNSILISVENKNEGKSATLQAKLEGEVSRLLHASSVDGAILSQSVAENKIVNDLAEDNKITKGKAQLIWQLVRENTNYEFEDLAKLSINDLNLLIESKHLEVENATAVGTASDKAYIGVDRATAIAMEHASVNRSNARELEVELDYDDGKFIYEVEFYADGLEYEYNIHAVTGEILSFEKDKDDDWDERKKDDGEKEPVATNTPNPTFAPTTAPTATPTVTPRPTPTNKPTEKPVEIQTPTNPPKTEQPAETRMSAAAARKAVLDRFGGIVQKIEYNYDERNPLYKGEALKDGRRVVFELNARTKEFKKWDEGNDSDWNKFSHALNQMITMDQAANMVISRTGKSNTFIQKIEFDWDDEKPLYKGEAFNKDMKYTFEIHAYKDKGF